MKRAHWPLLLIAVGTFVAIWTGWVQLGAMTGFGWMHPLPGIIPGLRMNAVITLPVSVEAYGAYALGVWLAAGGVPDRARSFARWSAIGALALGWTGQAASHVLTAAHVRIAPWPVTMLVSSVPVAAFGLAVALTHLLRTEAEPEAVPGTPASAPAAVQPSAPADVPVTAPASAPARNGARTRSAPGKRAAGAPDPLTEFASELASGSLPSVRSVMRQMHVGQDRAKAIRADLETAKAEGTMQEFVPEPAVLGNGAAVH